jgi:hypothetical protein
MAYEGNVSCIPGVAAGGDLSSDQYKFVKLTASGALVNTTNGGVCDGVLQDKPNASGRAATVMDAGVSKVLAGAVVAKGALVMSNAVGKAITAVPVASSATKAGAVGTYDLAAAATIVVDVDNAGNATVTWDAAAGTCTDSTSYPCADQDGLTEKVTIDGGVEQTVTFSGAHTTAVAIAASMNAQLLGCSVAVVSTHVVITSDTKGTGSTVAIGTGTCGLTWGSPAAGTGDVHDIDAVTPTEVKTRIEADSTANVNLVGSGFEIVSPTTGATSELDFKSGAALTPLGLSVEVKVGQDSDSHYRGRALEAAGAADVLFSINLAPTGKV